MHNLKKSILFLGRACLSFIFILSGIEKIFNWSATEESFLNQLCEVTSHSFQNDWLQGMLEGVIAWVPILLTAHIIFEIVGGLLVLFGIKMRLGAILLILALIPATLLFHNFWMLEGEKAQLQVIMFLKNLSILGGLMIVLSIGDPFSKSA